MSLESCNAYLEALELLNEGCNHGCTYCVDLLSGIGDVHRSLDVYFGESSTSRDPPQSPERWKIRTVELGKTWRPRIESATTRWFFQTLFSPKVEHETQRFVVRGFVDRLAAVVGDTLAFEVHTTPPMFYECAWEDFAFSSANSNWLLHFGVSD